MGTYDLIEALSIFGESLIKDDAGDLGYFSYRNRRRHRYRGKPSPHHPSPLHHYHFGTLLCLTSYILAPLALASDMQEDSNQ
jgi:hypothetical protein